MRYRSLIFILLLMTGASAYGQSAKLADDLFSAQEYAEARAVYDALLQKQPTHPLYLYRAARCAQELGELSLAEELFIKAGTKYPLRNFFLGEIYYAQWRMPEAIAAYETFLPTIDEQHERWPIVQKRIASAQLIARYLKHVVRIEVLGKQRVANADLLNAYAISEDNGILQADSLGTSYTTQRGDRRYYAVRITETTDSMNGSRIVLASQQRLLQQWEAPDTLAESVNNGARNCYPFVLTDGATLYFASDREGGLGGLDIYMTRYNAALGQWLPAENIGMPFNSPADDYLYATDESNGYAYFATDRHCVGTDSVEVYQIALGEHTYLRGLPDNELIALARLDSMAPLLTTPSLQFAEQTEVQNNSHRGYPRLYSQESASDPPLATNNHADADSIFFVLNDDATYTRFSDFRSDSARALYRQYIELEQVQEQAVEMLDNLRQQYYSAGDTTRASLQARIPILSEEINKRKRTLLQTIAQIRALESAQ